MDRRNAEVDAFVAGLEHPLAAEIAGLRAIVLGGHPGLVEGIKWNAPSYAVDGRDRVTMKLHPRDRISLVFHRGAKSQVGAVEIADPAGLLTWPAPDRAIATFRSLAEIEDRRDAIGALVAAWVEATA